MPCEAKAFIELDQVEVADLQTQPLHQLARRRHRADAHDARRHRGRGQPENARTRGQAMFSSPPLPRRGIIAGSAVIDAGRVARSDRAGIAHDRLQLAETFERGFGARDARPCRP